MTVHPTPRRLRAETGQTSIEWLGVAFVVVAIIVALAVLAPGPGSRIAESFTCLISRVTGDGAACATASSGGEPDFPCVLSSVTGSAEASVRIAVVEVGGGDVYVRETMSDGTVRVTFIEDGSVGLSLVAGAGASGQVGGVGGGGQASASGGVAITGSVGETRVFDDPADADQFIQDRITDEVIEALPSPLSMPASGIRWIVDQVTGHETPQGQAGPTTGGGGIAASGEATGALGPVRLDGEVLAEAGAQVSIHPDGSTDVTINVAASASGSATIGLGPGLGLGGGGSVTISLGPDGSPVAVSVTTHVEASGGIAVAGGLPLDGLDEALGDVLGSNGGRGTVTATLDLTDPALDGTVDGVLDDLRDAADGAPDLDAIVGSVGDLISGLAESTTVTVTTEDVDTTGIDGEVVASAGLGFGLDGGIERITTEISSAHYFDPVLGTFVPWTGCSR